MSEEPRQALVYFDVRPIRFGYLVREGSEEDVRQAILEACSRWGGIQEPLLPVTSDGAISSDWRPMLEYARIDYVCPVPGISDDVAAAIARDLARPLVPWHAARLGMHSLHASHLSRASRLQLAAVAPSGDVVDLAAVGAREDDEQVQAWSHVANVTPPPGAVYSASLQFGGHSLVGGTGHYCEETTLTGISGLPVVLWVARPDSVVDAVMYWNFRCLLPLSLTQVASALLTPVAFDDVSLISKAIEGAIKRHSYWTEPDIMLSSTSLDDHDLRGLADRLGIAIEARAGLRVHPSPSDVRPSDRPLTGTIGDPYPLVLRERTVGRRVGTLTYLDNRGALIRVDSPVPFTNDGGGAVRARISGPPQLTIPDSSAAAQLFHRDAVCTSGSPEIETYSMSLYQLRFAVPSRQEVLGAALSDAGIRYRLSDKGLLANGILNRVRDPSVLRDSMVLDVIDALTVHRIAYELKELRALFPSSEQATLEALASGLREVRQTSRTFQQVFSDVKQRNGGARPTDVGAALGRIVDAGLAVLGFKINCETCGMDSFLELWSDVDPRICPGCAGRTQYARDPQQNEPFLHYRLNTMVDRASDQGVLGHIVGALAIENFQPEALPLSLPGVNIEYPDATLPTEVDLLALVGKELWVGEAKPSQRSFDYPQIEQDLALAARLKANAYYMVSLKPFDLGFLLPMVRRAAGMGIRVYVLDSPDGTIRHVPPQPFGVTATPDDESDPGDTE